jgi:hypothetical protein
LLATIQRPTPYQADKQYNKTPKEFQMCIKHIKKYTQCPHSGGNIEHCEIYNAHPDAGHKKEKRRETINGLCRQCGGGLQPEPIITYIDPETISSWNRELESCIETPSSLKSGVKIVRKRGQEAVGGMKRFASSLRGNRSSGSSSQLDAVSGTESPSRDENSVSYLSTIEPLAESKTVHTSWSHSKRWQRSTENLSGLIHSSSDTTGGMDEIRPSLGREMETASIVTTWTKIISNAGGILDPGIVEVSQVDGDLYQNKIKVPQSGVVESQSLLQELIRSDKRLARVRDGRGYINYNLV